jgi:hypothetical protein
LILILTNITQVVINSNITKDTVYTRASETFHQWADRSYIYGLNFGSREDADTFGNGTDAVIQRLKSGGGINFHLWWAII